MDQTKVANRRIKACEQYQYDHQDAQSHYPCTNRSPICKTTKQAHPCNKKQRGMMWHLDLDNLKSTLSYISSTKISYYYPWYNTGK